MHGQAAHEHELAERWHPAECIIQHRFGGRVSRIHGAVDVRRIDAYIDIDDKLRQAAEIGEKPRDSVHVNGKAAKTGDMAGKKIAR